jgi:hypothetical protein
MGSVRNSQFPQFLDIMLIVQCADHLIGSPLALASESYSAKAWQKFEGIPALQIPTISWTQGSAVKVDSSKKTAMISNSKSGEQYEEKYDYLIAASGLRRVWPVSPQSTTREKYLCEAKEHIDLVKNARDGVVVIGGGNEPEVVGLCIQAPFQALENQSHALHIKSPK